MSERTIEDRLREEYFDLLPEIVRVADQLKAEVQYHLLPIAHGLKKHEQLVVKARVKECTSAIDSLRRRVRIPQTESTPSSKQLDRASVFNADTPDAYTLRDLRDLAGVRVLAFPVTRLHDIDRELHAHFPNWTADPVIDDETSLTLAFKYYGYCLEAGSNIKAEYQVTSMLTGLFWEVEHAAIYKSSPNLKGIARLMKPQTSTVYRALREFEDEFERKLTQILDNSALEH